MFRVWTLEAGNAQLGLQNRLCSRVKGTGRLWMQVDR